MGNRFVQDRGIAVFKAHAPLGKAEARALGYTTARLETNGALQEAKRLPERGVQVPAFVRPVDGEPTFGRIAATQYDRMTLTRA